MKLDGDDIEAIAQRVAQLLRDEPESEPSVRLVDAATVAERLGVERDWVYAHATQLGAVRLGGPRGRLRFDLAAVEQKLGERPAPSRSSEGVIRSRRGPTSRQGPRDLIPYHLHSPRHAKRPGSAPTPPARHREREPPMHAEPTRNPKR